MKPLPSIFVSHGAPTLPLDDVPAREFLRGLSGMLPRPKAILVASAHWETSAPAVSTALKPETIHDFYGFPRELYDFRYPASGAPETAARARELLVSAGFDTDAVAEQGLDHGAWVPLLLAWPDADIPVAQISIQPQFGAGHHIALGRVLAPLRDEGILVLGSGGAVHNLRALDWQGGAGTGTQWARDFDDWLAAALSAGDDAALADYRNRAPNARMAHPRDEHLMPVFVAYGAGGAGAHGTKIHSSFTHGSLSLAAYSFG
ncbi:MAG: dioxygenase [Alphaproteobacteria bacterium]|nr:dioxygenase [Alphaproteobacteria bacterium]